MGGSIYRVFLFIYTLIRISFYFWGYLLRGAVLYSFIPATLSLIEVSKHVLDKHEDKELREYYSEAYNSYKKYRMLSFIVVVIGIFLYVLLFFVNRFENAYSVAMIIVLFYFGVLLAIILSYMFHYLIFYVEQIRSGVALAFVSTIKHPVQTFYILLSIIAIYLLFAWNLVAFIALGPCLYGFLMVIIFNRFKTPILLNKEKRILTSE